MNSASCFEADVIAQIMKSQPTFFAYFLDVIRILNTSLLDFEFVMISGAQVSNQPLHIQTVIYYA
jgi:hypothetical protein